MDKIKGLNSFEFNPFIEINKLRRIAITQLI